MDIVWNQTNISDGLYRSLQAYIDLFSTPAAQDTCTVYYCMFAPQNLKLPAKDRLAFYSKESTINGTVNVLRGAEYDANYIQVKDLVGEIQVIRQKNKETIAFLALKNELVDIFKKNMDGADGIDIKEIVRFFNIIGAATMIQKRLSIVLKPRGIHKDGGPQTKRVPQMYDFGAEPSSIARLIPNSFKAPGALLKTYSDSIKRSAKGAGQKKKEENEAKMLKQFTWWFGGNVNMIKQLAVRPTNKENRRIAENLMTGMMGNINKHTPVCFPSTTTLRSITNQDKTLRDLIVNSVNRHKEPYVIGNLHYSCMPSEYSFLIYLIDTGFIFDHKGVLQKCTNYEDDFSLDDFSVIKNGETGVTFEDEGMDEPLKAKLFPDSGANAGVQLNQGQTIFSYRGGATSSKVTANFSRNSYLTLVAEFKDATSFMPIDPYLSTETDNLKEKASKLVKVEDYTTVVEVQFIDGGFLTNVKPIVNVKKNAAEANKENAAK